MRDKPFGKCVGKSVYRFKQSLSRIVTGESPTVSISFAFHADQMKTKSPLFPPRRVVEIFVAKGRKQHVATRYKNVHDRQTYSTVCCFALHDTQTLFDKFNVERMVIVTIIPFIQ